MLPLIYQAITVVHHYHFCDRSPAKSSDFSWNRNHTLAQRNPCIITQCPWRTCPVTGLLLHRAVSTVWAETTQSQDLIVWEDSGGEGLRVITVFTTCESPAAFDLWVPGFPKAWGRKARHSWEQIRPQLKDLLQSSLQMLSILPPPSGGFCFHTSLHTQIRTPGGWCCPLWDQHNITALIFNWVIS